MRLLDRWPRGRDGVFLGVAVGVVAALLASAAAVYSLSDRTDDTTRATAAPSRPERPLTPVVSRAGGFAVRVPSDLVGTKVPRGTRLSTRSKDIVTTIGATGRQGLRAGHVTALESLHRTFPRMRVEKTVRTTLGGLPARRSVGVVRRARGDSVIFSVTTGARGRRTWSVVMFAARDVTPDRLRRYYQPVLDTFHLVKVAG